MHAGEREEGSLMRWLTFFYRTKSSLAALPPRMKIATAGRRRDARRAARFIKKKFPSSSSSLPSLPSTPDFSRKRSFFPALAPWLFFTVPNLPPKFSVAKAPKRRVILSLLFHRGGRFRKIWWVIVSRGPSGYAVPGTCFVSFSTHLPKNNNYRYFALSWSRVLCLFKVLQQSLPSTVGNNFVSTV